MPKNALVIFSLAVFATLAASSAFAVEQGMALTLKADEGSSIVSLTGHTAKTNADVTVRVVAPNGNLVTVDQVTPDSNGDFTITLHTTGLLWKQDGLYTVTAQQGQALLYKITLPVEVIGGKTTAILTSKSSLQDYITGGTATSPSRGLMVNVDAPLGATTITVSGHTDRVNTDVTISVKAPNGNVVTVDQVTPDSNGDFTAKLQTTSQLWRQDGLYTITVHQANLLDYTTSMQVEIVDGAVIPEFGTVAALILAVAIISIIAVSARSRLSIMPKY